MDVQAACRFGINTRERNESCSSVTFLRSRWRWLRGLPLLVRWCSIRLVSAVARVHTWSTGWTGIRAACWPWAATKRSRTSSIGTGSTSFQVLSHATLAGGSLNNVSVFSTTGASYEITAVIGFHEKVIAATTGNGVTTSGTADFQFDNTQGTFVRLYYGVGGTKDANQLAGTGFNNGTLIFDSTVETIGGAFDIEKGPVVGDLGPVRKRG